VTDVEITVIGAGVVGLAAAERLSKSCSSVYLTEKNKTFGQETSSRNSEVIHAGLYYPEGSLKARLCVSGKKMLYEFCRGNNVPFNNCGKLIVATVHEEFSVIEGVLKTAARNGVNDLVIMEQDQVRELEPEIFALKAVFSPSTGIVDTHSLMKQLETNTVNSGGYVVYGNEVTGIRKTDNGYEVKVREIGGGEFTFTSKVVINSAGLNSDRVSEMTGIRDGELKINFCKGEYFRLRPPKNRLIKRLIYPVPHPNMEGIGIHVTIDMAGGVKLGPDVTFLETNEYDYTVDPLKREKFFIPVKRYLPFIEPEDLTPEMAGIRPKIQKPGDLQKDFYIREESGRGFPGFVNLIGMESPGLTSCLSIAEYVEELIKPHLD
jgi:L-2-hydroxyglutarate oxidase LhgO